MSMYRFTDSLANFKLKIKLRQLPASTLTEPEDIEELTLAWQEKHYSSFEVELFNLSDESRKNRRLFTYIDEDHYQDKVSLKYSSTNQHMFVMADLKRIDANIHDFEEHMLFSITVNNKGFMITSHELSHDNNRWYRVENKHRDIYEFNVQHVSQLITQQELLNERQLQTKMYSHQMEKLKGSINQNFSELDINELSTMVYLMGSIETAEGFDGNTLYISVQPCISDGWSIENSKDIYTQLSSSNNKQMVHFGCPLEYILINTNSFSTCCSLYFEVSSLDSWDRHILEGYGLLSIPSTPGSYNITLPTSKPNSTSLGDKLREYFIGGSTHPVLPKRDCISQFGYTTVSSGNISIKLNVIHQSQSIANKYAKIETLSQRKYLSLSVQAVSDVYHKVQAKASEVMKDS